MYNFMIWVGLCFSCIWCVSGAPAKGNGTVCGKEDLYAFCNLVSNPTKPSSIQGKVYFMQEVTSDCMYDFLSVEVEIDNIPSNMGTHKHGIHVHEYGDMTNGCQSMGGHYNPHGSTHGSLWHPVNARHIGDFGNVEPRKNGKIKTRIVDYLASLHGSESIAGRGIVLHAKEDDLGLNGYKDPESFRTGNAGERIACCIIGRSKTIDRSKFSLYGRKK